MMSNVPREPNVSTTGRFPSRGARDEFLRQVQLWNAVEGLPLVTVQSIDAGDRVKIRTVASAGRIVVRLIESVGGVVERDLNFGADTTTQF
jgi:hypothetical protein